jgi:hypothetical protein
MKQVWIRPAVMVAVVLSVVVLGRFYARPVMAQVRAALTQNIDEPGRNPYQEQIFSSAANCAAGTKFCNFNYSIVPANKRLVITNVSGYVDTQEGMLPNCNMQSNFGGSQYAAAFFTGVRGPTFNGGTRIFVNVPTKAYFGQGETPHLFCGLVSTTDNFVGGGEMVISGYYVDNP